METSSHRPRILIVDDEPAMLRALARTLGRKYDVVTADGAQVGLPFLQRSGPFAAVLSDLRMPGMGGTDFLELVRAASPDTVRILITGRADVDAACGAINRGEVFRILRKPCDENELWSAIDAAVELHATQHAERARLEQALAGSLRLLIELLGLASPAALARAKRLRVLARALNRRLAVPDPTALETAAVFSQIGVLALPPTLAAKVASGQPLEDDEKSLAARVPAVAERLLAHLPCLERVCDILLLCERDFAHPEGRPPEGSDIPLPARVLRVLLGAVELEQRGCDAAAVVAGLDARAGELDPLVLDALAAHYGVVRVRPGVREMGLREVSPGMVFADDVRTRSGDLLIARGMEVTPAMIELFWTFSENVDVHEPVRVLAPPLSLLN